MIMLIDPTPLPKGRGGLQGLLRTIEFINMNKNITLPRGPYLSPSPKERGWGEVKTWHFRCDWFLLHS